MDWKNVFQSIKQSLLLTTIFIAINSVLQFTPLKLNFVVYESRALSDGRLLGSLGGLAFMLLLLLILIIIQFAVNIRRANHKVAPLITLGAAIGLFLGVLLAMSVKTTLDPLVSNLSSLELKLFALNFFAFPIGAASISLSMSFFMGLAEEIYRVRSKAKPSQ